MAGDRRKKADATSERLDRRRWLAAEHLPDDLRAAITSDPTLEIRGVGTRSGIWYQLLLPFGVAAAVSAILSALLVPNGLFADPFRWAGLIAGGLALGAWVAWRRAPSMRPFKGQALYVGPASLVVVDHTSVEVIPAEHLELQDQAILCDGELVDRGARQHVFRESLEAAIAAATDDEDARWDDPWRRAATAAPALTGPSGQLGRVGLGAAAGLVAALVLEGVAGLAGGMATSGAADRWSSVTADLTEQTAQVSRLERKAHELRLTSATTTGDLLPVMEAIATRDAADERRKAIIDRFVELATAELAGARESGDTLPLMAVSRYYGLDDRIGDPARARFAELARAELAAATEVEDITWVFGVDVEYGVDPTLVDAARSRFAELARERMAAADASRQALRPLVGAANQYELGDDIEAEVTARFVARAEADLAKATTTDELDQFMTDGLELRLGDDHLEVVRARYAAVARTNMRGARTASDVEGLFAAIRTWQLGDEVLAELVARYEALAARDIAAARTTSALEPFVGAEYRFGLSSGWEQRVLDPRVTALIGRDVAAAKTPAELAAAFIAIRDFEAGDELQRAAEAKYLELGSRDIASARAFLGWHGFDYMDEIQQLVTELEQMCRRYPTKTRAGAPVSDLFGALLTGMCDDVPASLTYRLTSNTDEALGMQGAAALHDALYDTSVALGAAIEFEMYPRAGSGDVLMSVVARGPERPSADRPGAVERDCTIKVTSQGAAGHRGTGLSESIDAVCVGLPEDDLE